MTRLLCIYIYIYMYRERERERERESFVVMDQLVQNNQHIANKITKFTKQ